MIDHRFPVRAALLGAVLSAAVGLAVPGCGSTGSVTSGPPTTGHGTTGPGTTAPSTTGPGTAGPAATVSGADVRITNPALVAAVKIGVGSRVSLVLAPDSSSHHPDGSPVMWPAPTSTDPAVLTTLPVENCPPSHTCVTFEAKTPGRVRVQAVGPGGIICSGGRCVGVSAPDYLVPVTVEPGPAHASVTLRPSPG